MEGTVGDDDYYWGDAGEILGIGSLHTLNDTPVRRKRTGPQVRMGFHPPSKAWVHPPKKKGKSNG